MKKSVDYIIYKANDIYELPIALCDTVTECSKYIGCCRDEIYDSIKFGDVIKCYKVDIVTYEKDIYGSVVDC